jgi:hypothetical protein
MTLNTYGKCVKLNVINAECRNHVHYAECRCAECRGTLKHSTTVVVYIFSSITGLLIPVIVVKDLWTQLKQVYY